MGELTAEQAQKLVKAAWPRAFIRWSVVAGCWVVSGRPRKRNLMGLRVDSKGQVHGRISEVCLNEADAWADAAKRLTESKSTL